MATIQRLKGLQLKHQFPLFLLVCILPWLFLLQSKDCRDSLFTPQGWILPCKNPTVWGEGAAGCSQTCSVWLRSSEAAPPASSCEASWCCSNPSNLGEQHCCSLATPSGLFRRYQRPKHRDVPLNHVPGAALAPSHSWAGFREAGLRAAVSLGLLLPKRPGFQTRTFQKMHAACYKAIREIPKQTFLSAHTLHSQFPIVQRPTLFKTLDPVNLLFLLNNKENGSSQFYGKPSIFPKATYSTEENKHCCVCKAEQKGCSHGQSTAFCSSRNILKTNVLHWKWHK